MSINETETKNWTPNYSVDNVSSTTARAGTTAVPNSVLEKLDVTRYNPVKNFGNPTPLALAGLAMCLTPLSCQLMGWRNSDTSGIANNGANVFCGGFLLLLGGLLEFFLGNTFSFVVFGAYGGFFLALGFTLIPGFGVLGSYTTSEGALNADLYNSFDDKGFFYLFVGVLSIVFLICSLRTNVVLVVLFLAYSLAFPLLAASEWQAAQGNKEVAHNLLVGGGAACFVVSLMTWYALINSLLQSVDFPFELPMGDLSSLFPGASQRKELRLKGESTV
ncbi:hypothetical protein K440DRAFT_638914 [Wilcoxina mikolae CBS 423.85]|nr:hypothetical protein K440DRAFT_638914 [Wilcoxina mikolae CBS 423.85]